MSSAKRLLSATIVALAASAATAQAATITEFPLPVQDRGPAAIVAGADGDLWFTEQATSRIADVTPSGVITEYTGLAASAGGVAAGPNGKLWFTEPSAGKVARVDPSTHVFNEYSSGNSPTSITSGPDGNIWFTESANPGRIGRANPNGVITQFSTNLTADGDPSSITAGPDGNLWFTESGNPGRIGQITPSGAITEYTAGLTANSDPSAITAGPDGNLWFTESGNGGAIGRITPAGTITEFKTGLTPNSDPTAITAGPDGDLWFTESASPGRIGRITPSGAIAEVGTPTTASSPQDIVAGPDGNLWFTELGGHGQIARMTPAIPAPTATTQVAFGIQQTTATLAGSADPDDTATTYHFDWGPTTAYGQQSPATDAAVGSDSSSHGLTEALTGLLPGTTYHYRLAATNAAHTTDGADMTFVTPAQPPLATSNPLAPPASVPPPPPAPPAMGRTAVAGVVSGTVFVRVPGSSTLQPLGAGQNIPMGSLINATHGVVKVTDAIDRKGHTQSATVWAGSFVMTQARTGRGLTTFKLAGSLSCPSAHGVTTAAARSRAPVKLWGKDNHGRYSTRGRNSVATVRGTVWETVESCAGTRTVVKRGLVSVRDLHRHRSVLVRAGHSYLAKR